MYIYESTKGGGVLSRRSDSPRRGSGFSSVCRRSCTAFSRAVRESVILSAIDRFVQCVYGALQNGFFGTVFSTYPVRESGDSGSRSISSLRRFVIRTADGSGTVFLFRKFLNFLMRCRLRVYGTFLLTFGLYSAIAYLMGVLSEANSAPTMTLVSALVCIGIALPLLPADQSLAQALADSALALPILSFLGIRREALHVTGTAGRSNLALVIGMVLGLTAFVIPSIYILVGFVGLFLAYRVFITPELGVAALFFGMPFLPTMVLVALVAYTAVCYAIKLFLGKRRLQLEAVDFAALAFAFSLACGGVFSFSTGSLKPTMVLVCFLCAYFLTVLLIRTGEWLKKCLWCAIAASTLVALYGIFQYFSGSLIGANAWLDSNMFEDISVRVISTLENPNMLAEYLILLFPLAAAQLVSRSGLARRSCAFFACAAIGACVILTWSRGAWLGLLFGGFVFLLIWSRRTLYLIVAAVAAVPFLPMILPDSIISRFTSIGNLADSSTSYRVNIWRGTVHMLEDYWMTGVGIGESAWATVYPRYSLAAIETAPHAHNLYLQTWVQTGIVGLLLLIAFLVLLLQCHFSYYRLLGRMRDSVADSVLAAHLKPIGEENSFPGSGKNEITAMRLEAAAPLCGILATLLQGLTDYTWYNYRVYLMFWLAAGLSVAYTRCGRADMRRLTDAASAQSDETQPTEAALSLPLHTPDSSSTQKGTSSHA